MQTAEDLFNKYKDLYQFEEGSPEYLVDKEDFKNALKEFAQMHVEAALKAASENALVDMIHEQEYRSDDNETNAVISVDKGYEEYIPVDFSANTASILNAYPSSNIK